MPEVQWFEIEPRQEEPAPRCSFICATPYVLAVAAMVVLPLLLLHHSTVPPEATSLQKHPPVPRHPPGLPPRPSTAVSAAHTPDGWTETAQPGAATAASHGPSLEYQRARSLYRTHPDAALRGFRRAAKHGDADAAYTAALMLEQGTLVPRDLPEGFALYRQAAEAGLKRAVYMVGYCYHLGKGVAQDVLRAMHWYRRASGLGHKIAAFNLGLCYKHGWGRAQELHCR